MTREWRSTSFTGSCKNTDELKTAKKDFLISLKATPEVVCAITRNRAPIVVPEKQVCVAIAVEIGDRDPEARRELRFQRQRDRLEAVAAIEENRRIHRRYGKPFTFG